MSKLKGQLEEIRSKCSSSDWSGSTYWRVSLNFCTSKAWHSPGFLRLKPWKSVRVKAYLTSERPTPGSGAAWLGSRSTRQQWLAAPGQVCGELGWSWNRNHPWQFAGLQPLDSLVPHLLQRGRELAGVSRGWPEPTSTPGAAQAEEGRKPAWGSLCRAGLCRQKGKGNQEIGAPGGERVRKDFDFPHPRRVCTIFFFLIWKVSVRAFKSPRVGGPWPPWPGAWPSGLRAVAPTGPAPADLGTWQHLVALLQPGLPRRPHQQLSAQVRLWPWEGWGQSLAGKGRGEAEAARGCRQVGEKGASGGRRGHGGQGKAPAAHGGGTGD